jgi:hypothetical protein
MARHKLVNVRLDADDAGKVRALKERGVELSAIVRRAVRSEYARRVVTASAADIVKTMQEIYADHPAQPVAARSFDVHDRRALAAAMRRHVRPRRK